MQSNNPILNRVETHADYSQPMTVQGAIQKSVLLTVIAAVVGMALFLYCFMTLNIIHYNEQIFNKHLDSFCNFIATSTH